ncbi:hypothetical protein [Catalinimonas niigatensis]|uniref:hypothetical protein n=1 Tax=Catalinimonas niigatensis TaxID=1397264 RepID=UPI002665EE56|nr:hypothetical protein [Catalinimonas niigatensis]WPP48349.1 hypothetical protein PZB72_16880 [Catalinimonas niigatensis]
MKKRRKLNEKKFKHWKSTPAKGRLYFYAVEGKYGWSARYLKEVDEKEETIRFWQEIYDEKGKLREVHEKYPVDKGHIKLNEI